MKIAVCIPTYNRADIISDAIDSLIIQKDSKFDIHVFDNCSTDNTEELIKSKYDNQVIYHKNENNLGFVGNVNKCLSLNNKYDWIGILHSDDLHTKNSISVVSYYLNKFPNAGLIFSAYDVIDDKKQVLEKGMSKEQVFKAGVKAIQISQGSIPCSATFYNSKAIKSVGFYDEKFPYSADEEYNTRIAISNDLVRMGKVIAYHRFHANNLRIETWLEPNFSSNYEEMRRKMLLKTSLTEKEINKAVSKKMAISCAFIASTFFKYNYLIPAIRYNNLAWKYSIKVFVSPKLLLNSLLIYLHYLIKLTSSNKNLAAIK